MAPKERLSDDQLTKRQRMRSIALALALAAFAAMLFLVTIVRLGSNVANRPL